MAFCAGVGPFFSAALMISSLKMIDEVAIRTQTAETYSRRLRAAHKTTHSTQSSLPSPRVCHTAFSSGVLPVILILVPPPPVPFAEGGFFCIFPNSIRLGGILCPA